jgi:RNA polymerase sigma-B factor
MPAPTSRPVDLGKREETITSLLPLARRLANRYRGSGESQEDLEQVAYLGLVKAADRYESERGSLVRYAVPTILGELRRHFRDKGWGTHVPRSVQENLMRVTAAVDDLSTQLGRTPSASDIADATGIPVEDVVEALEAARSYKPASLDAPAGGDATEARPLGDTLGSTDSHFEYVEVGVSIEPAFQSLPKREQKIVELRFFEDLTQSEIAGRMGISQMHVSRLLRRALDDLHEAVA